MLDATGLGDRELVGNGPILHPCARIKLAVVNCPYDLVNALALWYDIKDQGAEFVLTDLKDGRFTLTDGERTAFVDSHPENIKRAIREMRG